MRQALINFPKPRDQFELQAMGVRFDTEPKPGYYGYTAEVLIDDDALELIAEHGDRFSCVFKSDVPNWKWGAGIIGKPSYRKLRCWATP